MESLFEAAIARPIWILALMFLSAALAMIATAEYFQRNKQDEDLEETENITERELEETIIRYEKDKEKVDKYKVMLKKGFEVNTRYFTLYHHNGKFYRKERNQEK